MMQFPESVTTSNEANYENLISLIENSQEQLALIIVACDDLSLRQQTIERYEQEAKQSQIRAERIILGMEPSLRAGLAKLGIGNQDGVVVTVTGVEWLLRVKTRAADAQSDLDKFFGYLQWTREGLREFRYPIVLWVTYPILQEMSSRAPDFWSWRKAVLFFESETFDKPIVPVVQDLNPLKRLFDLQNNDNFIPPPAEILSEIHQLESKNPTSPNLATLYGKLAGIYAKRTARSESIDLEFEQQQATDAFGNAINRYRELNKQSALANMLLQFGNFLCTISLCHDAIHIYQQSLDIWRKIGDRNGEAMSLNNLGYASRFLGQYQQAIEFQQQSIEIQHEIEDRSGEAKSLNNLGSIYGSIGQYQQAIELLQKSLEIQHELGDLDGEASSLNNLGLAYASLGKYQRAIDFYRLSLKIKRELYNRNGEANSLGNLGAVYESLGEYQQAIDLYQQCLEIKHELGDLYGEAIALFDKACAISQYENRHFEALEIFKQARDIYVKLKLDEKIKECDEAICDLAQFRAK
jgi:tetratricopeptide (TPR) repeat protein